MSHFSFVTSGESHGKGLIVTVQGLPAGLPADSDQINYQLRRRQQGYGRGGRMKIEQDEADIFSGVRHGKTLGSPISLIIRNRDYDNWQDVMDSRQREFSDEKRARRLTRPRPGHTDLAGGIKYDTHDLRDILERASARETAARVAAGALARLLLDELGVSIASHTAMIGGIPTEPLSPSWEEIGAIPEDSPLRCVDPVLEGEMISLIDRTRDA